MQTVNTELRALIEKWRFRIDTKGDAQLQCADELEAALGSGPDGKMGGKQESGK
jgi:hypothetical protein